MTVDPQMTDPDSTGQNYHHYTIESFTGMPQQLVSSQPGRKSLELTEPLQTTGYTRHEHINEPTYDPGPSQYMHPLNPPYDIELLSPFDDSFVSEVCC